MRCAHAARTHAATARTNLLFYTLVAISPSRAITARNMGRERPRSALRPPVRCSAIPPAPSKASSRLPDGCRLVDARVNEARQIEACVGGGEPGRVRTAISRT
eukprot:1854023-Prymnesium_polylepis.1